MAWYYEILGKDDVVLEASEPVYATQFDAQMAGYQRMKKEPRLFGPLCRRRVEKWRADYVVLQCSARHGQTD